MTGGETGFAAVSGIEKNRRTLLAYAPVASSDWSVGVVIPEHELFADIKTLNHTVLGIGAAGFAILFFSVGDVSDKGVPAALFMAVTKTLMKGIAERGLTPSQVLSRVNAELCQNNDAAMFVTLACGVLDISTGELQYSNAGHNPPVLIKKDKPVKFLWAAG
jgi:hypothetical protein